MRVHFFFLIIGLALWSCSLSSQTDQFESEVELEKHRPLIHFTPESAWMNDPNGMFYYEGEYHLFFQYYPDSTVWGPMHWGHAISEDLVHWDELPIALYPDSLGYIFSGSAVVDWNNTSGFGSGDTIPIVAIFTHHSDLLDKSGVDTFQYQSLAYSLDKGRSWTKYAGNPVLPNPGIRDFRDPKVFWYPDSQEWMMILAVKDHVEIYASKDLKNWDLLSDFGTEYGAHGGVWECPDLFPLVTPEGIRKWVMLVSINPGGPVGGSATQYFVGDFDGTSFYADFTPDEVHWLDYGADNYAGVTWSDIPANDGRRLFMGWMSNWNYGQVVPTDSWRSGMTLPRSLHLLDTDEGWLVASRPVVEIDQLMDSTYQVNRLLVAGMHYWQLESPFRLKLDLYRTKDYHNFEFQLKNSVGEQLTFGYNKAQERFYIDRVAAGDKSFAPGFGAIHETRYIQKNDIMKLDIIVDDASVEIFVNDGILVFTELVFPKEPYDRVVIETRDQPLLIIGEVQQLKSMWSLD